MLLRLIVRYIEVYCSCPLTPDSVCRVCGIGIQKIRGATNRWKGCSSFIVVRAGGLEPPHREILDPKSNAATNYATRAFFVPVSHDEIVRLVDGHKISYLFWIFRHKLSRTFDRR